jgi:glycerol-3-phosphate dehydrogenase (NAD(P)+)
MSTRVTVVGAGSWGTTLANLLAKKGLPVRIWAYEADVVATIEQERENRRFLPGVPLHEGLRATGDLAAALAAAQVVVSVSPSQHVRRVMSGAVGALGPNAVVVNASKGIETSTLQTMAEVMQEVLPAEAARRSCYLSGPSFAAEVARELPTAVTIASQDETAARRMQELFQTPYFRVYTSADVRGVELGGSLKNVIALAAGMSIGLGLGHNALAALITRGLAEITRLGVTLGADPITLSGLSGMGDLILTCTGHLSRNRSVGVALGEGHRLEDVLGGMTGVAEGVDTTRAAHALAQRTGIEMPLVATVHAVLFEGLEPRQAVESLMLREPKPEVWG